jgi:farnesyl diphosphate synthase
MTDYSDPEQLIGHYQERITRALEQRLTAADINPSVLHSAMRYAAFSGGKRIRPVLVYAAGQAMHVPLDRLDAPACAVELIHTYSLIHDDLPAMDDDDLRRGKPTCHKAFDEATAILAGDALQALAFQILAEDDAIVEDTAIRLNMVATLAYAAGSRGMAGGQAIDLAAIGRTLDLAELENMHIHKTGALIRACVLLGAMSRRDGDAAVLEKFDHYGKCIGLAFQIRDDILDVTTDTETLGKTQGADIALNKPTYPALLGLQGAREHAEALCRDALDSLSGFGAEADTLRWIARYIVQRAY